MFKTKFLAATAMAAVFAIPASAQVADSFDNLVDTVLDETNASFFSGAVNTAVVDGSVNITAGVEAAAGTTDLIVSTATTNIQDDSISSDEGGFADVSTEIEESTVAFASTTNEITQEFGDVSSVAAGAISDSTLELDQTGATATSAVNNSAGGSSFIADASDVTGEAFGVMQGALNTANIDGSINMETVNANVVADSVGSVAAGAINTGSITATFVGGSSSGTDIDVDG